MLLTATQVIAIELAILITYFCYKETQGAKSWKPRNKRNSKPKKEYNSKRESPCKFPNHQGHEWSDCFNNPYSKKFKGTAKTLEYFASMSESNTNESKEEHNNIESNEEYGLFN